MILTVADKCKMGKPPTKVDSTREPLDFEALCHQLLLLQNVRANWEAGRLLDRHFGKGKRAEPNDMVRLVKKLKKFVPVGASHIYKCRQFFTLFRTEEELNLLLERDLKW